MRFPFKGQVKVTSPYGSRILNGTPDWHPGLDLVGLTDKTIYAPCDGTVLSSQIITDKSNRTWEWGNYIAIYSHADGVVVYMCHLSERYVRAGDVVKAGQPIGKEGNTGYSFGSHCHFEIRRNGTAINPCELLGIVNVAGKEYDTKETAKKADQEEEMKEITGEEIYKKLTEYLSTLPESGWSKDEGNFAKATEKGILDGTNPRGLMTREQLAAVLGRKNLL